VPFKLLMNRTTLIGYFTTFVHGILALSVFYYWCVLLCGKLERASDEAMQQASLLPSRQRGIPRQVSCLVSPSFVSFI
jgi:hypothetical protein